ncbi:MAG: hypothetical protein EOO00_14600 [Chitinophagaceae bacterium]|nr:MAG: hypothetical protein EOO00_14600 [Chitinophagaceae bacterium]
MKKIFVLMLTTAAIISCNSDNSSDTGSAGSSDTLNHSVSDDRNNRNTTVYDSTGIRSGGKDTASYEAMPNKITDSTPK